ncbi:aminofutalosine synthase MqnE [Engelhardtia mirabilis]|uniref:Aminodeoxyfutalosine synthase n=1 Tax=Engelhardtia mirabilis TaxID=2528011 RepID=A0A518BMU2_9BACT|nr:Aminodeoxyfutalosine synthase [Planctomycetes bacterium Pla133]QDV02621.1 Aminodeoxyfutalosine synthase [Planctomycetes bacterium Pla86]
MSAAQGSGIATGGINETAAAGSTKERLVRRRAEAAGLGDIADKVLASQRLSCEDGLRLYEADLHAVGALANWVRERIHGDRTYFNVNQHINYTNWCNKFCSFCSFDRLPGQEGAYLLEPEQAAAKLLEHADQPVTEVHMVAGVWPKIPYDYYLNLLRAVKAARPEIHVKAFTMVELDQIAKTARHEGRHETLAEVLEDLKAAGLGSCPGGGAEVFSERIHAEGYKNKISGEQWLATAREVHRAGLRSNCTMLHGHMETIAERVDHLDRLRRLQDETGGFQTYIPLSFHPENNEWSHYCGPTALDELRELAVARLLLDNIPHIKAYWILMDVPVAQTALAFGADDVDGTVVEEKIYHDAGATTPQEVGRAELVRWIRDAGRVPVERDTLYNVVWSADEQLAPVGAPAPVAG